MVIVDSGRKFGSFSGFGDLPSIGTYINNGGALTYAQNNCGVSDAYANASAISTAIANLPAGPETTVVQAAEAATRSHLITRLTDYNWNWNHGGVISGALFQSGDRIAAAKSALADVCTILNQQYPALDQQGKAAAAAINARLQQQAAAQQAAAAAQQAQSTQVALTTTQSNLNTAQKVIDTGSALQTTINQVAPGSTAATQSDTMTLILAGVAGLAVVGGVWYLKKRKSSSPMAGYRRRKHRR